MRIIGINDSHNATVCLLENGEITFSTHEERLNREKNWSGFPKESLKFLLEYVNLTPADIDYVVFAGEGIPFGLNRITYTEKVRQGQTLNKTIKKYLKRTFIKDFYDSYRDKIDRNRRIELAVSMGFKGESISFLNHHLCHAAAAYYGWGKFEEPVLVLSNDGFGDDLCATVNIGEKGHIKKLAEIPGTDSIGTLYSLMTTIMGMIPLEHEYKLMGMAPYSSEESSKKVAKMFQGLMVFDETQPLIWKRAKNCPEINHSLNYLKKMCEYVRFDHLAGGVQLFVEKMLTQWVKNCVKATGINKVVLGGGVFMNVKANKLISELPEIEDLFVFPSCGDESNALGAAYYVNAEKNKTKNGSPNKPFSNIYLGPEFSSERVEKDLSDYFQKEKYEYTKEPDINKKTAELLAEGNIVARFNGREEYGARALGNRSILADPSNKHVVRIINEMIKNRDFWMPFAPAARKERVSDYILNPTTYFSPYMMMTYDTKGNRDEFFSGIHPYDWTSRMQFVDKGLNPGFYKVIEEFEKRTGRGVVLNTSFNLHGYPIVHTPKQALEVLLNSGLKNLVIEDFVVKKK